MRVCVFACFVRGVCARAFAMSATEPTEAYGWDGFVRETLAGLEAELRKSETGMLPPRRVARSPKGLLSPLTMANGSKAAEVAHVPWQNIFRNHNRLLADAWPTADELDLKSVVVVGIGVKSDARLNSNRFLYGWFVRFVDSPTHLVRIPPMLAVAIAARLQSHSTVTSVPSLIGKFLDCSLLEQSPVCTAFDFSSACVTCFTRYRIRLGHQVRIEEAFAARESRGGVGRKRKVKEAKEAQEMEEAKGDSDRVLQTCTVCLDEHESAQNRCWNTQCNVSVCEVCHLDARGFCPVCDRSHLNARYECGSCEDSISLCYYGYDCLSCNARTLCRSCYREFSECRECGSHDAGQSQ